MASAILYEVVSWSSSITAADRRRLVKRVSAVLCCPLDLLEVVVEMRLMAKHLSIMENTSQDHSHACNEAMKEISNFRKSFKGPIEGKILVLRWGLGCLGLG